MAYQVFIDGGEGTTGLKIQERFRHREDVTLLKLPEEQRKDPVARKEMLNKGDFVFLCLPDQAAKDAVEMIENPDVRVIDASTAHRTLPHWAYGLPELSSHHREKIAHSKRVAVPGCYASGFNTLVYPLIAEGILSSAYPVTCFGLSGYSGGGKQVIATYEGDSKPQGYHAPRLYALGQNHKHQGEMQVISGLNHKPMFNPIIDDYFAGMLVNIPLPVSQLSKKLSARELHQALQHYYQGQTMVQVREFMGETTLSDGFLSANTLENKDFMELFVFGDENQILLSARLDNLGKGASGAAVQCMNIMMGLDETTGLRWK